MQTLIKWPGGKSKEYNIIRPFIPEYTGNYIEPFFGGGAVFFNMHPQKAIINDISSNLMDFYRCVKTEDAEFKVALMEISDQWNCIRDHACLCAEELLFSFDALREHSVSKKDISRIIQRLCSDIVSEFTVKYKYIFEASLFECELQRMALEKFFRTYENEKKFEKTLTDHDVKENIVTGFMGGYYMYLRSLFNAYESGRAVACSVSYKTAVFFFVREFCYGSMFRYNRSGEFNIPYGGIAYNHKNIKKKIEILFSEEVRDCFAQTSIYNDDFEKILDLAEKDDFVFLDPPYDTNFSEYENRTFDWQDQARLANRLHGLRAKFLLIIKNTSLISDLYRNNGYRVYAFDKRYAYCVKGRNDRNAVHLIITNYD